MRTARILSAVALIGLAFGPLIVLAQDKPATPDPKPEVVAPKPVTPAEEALISAAKDQDSAQKLYKQKFDIAKEALTKSEQVIKDRIAALQKELNDKIKEDKKYHPLLDQVDVAQKYLSNTEQKADADFQKDVGPLAQKISSDAALVQGLTPVVRKEKGFPDGATFDPATQTWSGTTPPLAPK